MARDGGRVAFATWMDGQNVVVIDGRPGEAFDFVTWPPAMSDDGRVVAYAARLGAEQYCVESGKRSAPYRSVGIPVLSADGRVCAFPASDGAAWFAVSSGHEGPRFDWVGNLTVHPSGDRLAYCADRRGESFVVADGRRGRAFDRVTRPAISGDGRVVAYGARDRGRWRLVVGEKEIPAEGEIASVFLNADGSRAGYVLDEPGGFSVVGPKGRGPRFDWVGWPTLTVDGRVVYFANRGRAKVLVTDDRETELGDWVVWDPVLNREGTEIAFGARIGRVLWWKVMPVSGSDHLEGVR